MNSNRIVMVVTAAALIALAACAPGIPNVEIVSMRSDGRRRGWRGSPWRAGGRREVGGVRIDDSQGRHRRGGQLKVGRSGRCR